MIDELVPLALGAGLAAPTANACTFDGTNDYLSRLSNFTGNTSASKQFTLSFWMYYDYAGMIYCMRTGGNDKFFAYHFNKQLSIQGFHFNNTALFEVTIPSAAELGENTWYHVLLSVDLSNNSLRHIYINDEDWSSKVLWFLYINNDIYFPSDDIGIASRAHAPSGTFKGRLAHMFFDTTYMDLSIEANRRYFIDEEGKPANPSGLNPLMYMPMDDPDDCHVNKGTGGDFTQVGNIKRSSRGPEQENCVATKLISGEYAQSTTSIGAGSSKTLTFSFCADFQGDGALDVFQVGKYSGNGLPTFYVGKATDEKLLIEGWNANRTTRILLLQVTAPRMGVGRFVQVSGSVDMADQSKTRVLVDNEPVTVAYSAFTDDLIWLEGNTSAYSRIGVRDGGYYLASRLGELWFDTVYTDLATENIFWDEDLNEPKSVARVMRETSITPLMAFPCRADDFGKNLGSAQNFAVTGAPMEGSRGPNEFWAHSVSSNVTDTAIKYTNYLSNAGLTGAPTAAVNTTCVIAVKTKDTALTGNPTFFNIGGAYNYTLKGDASEYCDLMLGGGQVATLGPTFNTTNWEIFVATTDGTNAVLRNLTRGTVHTVAYTNTIDLSGRATILGTEFYEDWAGHVGFIYLTDNYLDFTQDTVLEKFFNPLGWPKDLSQSIDDGDIPSPLVYMKFEDAANLGANSGTGGDFLGNGTLYPGEDVEGKL